MKKILKSIFGIIITTLFIFGNLTPVNAASAKISVSANTSRIVVGNTFTVTIKVSSSTSLGSWEFTPSYTTSKFKLVSGETPVVGYANSSGTKSKTYTYKFKAIGTGTGTISVKSTGAYSWGEEKLSISAGSDSVKVITQAELEASYSKNNNLSSLSVEGLTLSPKFSKDVTQYNVEADSNTQEVKINAKKDDSSASISGTGTHKVTEGENKIVVTVTAENGSTKNYTILVNVTDPNPINVKVNDKDYVVVKRESNLESPENYEKKEIIINEQKIPAFYNEVNDITLVGLKDNEGQIGLFIYNEKNNSYTPYTEVTLNQIKLYPLSITDEKENYTKSNITINDEAFEALQLKNSEYSIIYAKDLTTGEENYYKYDSKTNSVIRYSDEETKPYIQKIEEYEKMLLLLFVETILIFIILICILIVKIRNNKKRKRLKEEMLLQKEQEERQKELEEKKKEKKKK